jgi:hypothetical protein
MVPKMGMDADGWIPPCSVKQNRHEAWAWDCEKEIVLKGQQKATPRYKPTWWQRVLDVLYLRRKYFKGNPKEHVKQELKRREEFFRQNSKPAQ